MDPAIWQNPLVVEAFGRYKQPGSELQNQKQLADEIFRITDIKVSQPSISSQLHKLCCSVPSITTSPLKSPPPSGTPIKLTPHSRIPLRPLEEVAPPSPRPVLALILAAT